MPTIIYKSSTPQRVDKYLSVEYPDFSRRYFQDGLSSEAVLINKDKKKSSYKLKEGDKIEINLSLELPEAITELPADKRIKFESSPSRAGAPALGGLDDQTMAVEVVAKYPDFFIINKPVGLIVHPSVFDIRNQSIPPTLAGGLLSLDKNLRKVGEDRDGEFDITRPGIVHRLDKDTSGLMIVPRTQEAFVEFKRQFKSREVSKTYLALCWNMQTQKDKLKLADGGRIKYKSIDRLIGKSKNDHTKQSTNQNPRYLVNPKESETLYAMIQSGQFPCNYRVNNTNKQAVPLALIQAKPKTGRKHQVRVHLSSVGLPLVGDKKYTSKLLKNCNKNFKHHLLHAHKLQFTYQGEKYSFTSDLPKHFEELIG